MTQLEAERLPACAGRRARAGNADEPQPAGSIPARRGRTLFSASVLAVYAALGLLAFWPLLSDGSGRIPFQRYGDPAQTVWFFGWTAHAVVSGHNPFFSPAVNVPYGVNMAQLTFMPLLGVLFLPLTLLAGPISSVTVCFIAAMPLSAASAYAVLRTWRVWAPAAALGGLAYGFSPYMVNQGGTHLNLVFLPLPPLMTAVMVKLLTGPRRPLLWGTALGALAAAQFLISSEILAITVIVSLGGLLMAGAYCVRHHPQTLHAALRPALKGAPAACTVSGALLAYPIWYQFRGPRHYVGAPWPYQSGYNTNLVELVAPTPHMLLHPVLGATGASLYAASYLEDGAYLGFGLLAAVTALLWIGRRSLRMRLTAFLAGLSVVLSFGDYVSFNGTTHRVVMPFYYLSKLPPIGDILPIRFSFATAGCVAALLAFGLDGIRRAGVRAPGGMERDPKLQLRHANVALVAVCLSGGLTWLPAWPLRTEPVRALPSAVIQALPAGDPTVLTYPYPVTAHDTAMLWEAEAGFTFRLIGVYARVPQANGAPDSQAPVLDPPAVQNFLEGAETASGVVLPSAFVVAAARDFVIRQHVGAVVVSLSETNSAAVSELFSTALGPPNLDTGGFQVWDVLHRQGESQVGGRKL